MPPRHPRRRWGLGAAAAVAVAAVVAAVAVVVLAAPAPSESLAAAGVAVGGAADCVDEAAGRAGGWRGEWADAPAVRRVAVWRALAECDVDLADVQASLAPPSP